MDDFLYKLRNARKKTGYDRNRRNQDNYSPRNDRNKPKGKKPQTLPVGVDHLSAIRRTLEAIAENQKQMMAAERQRRNIEERKSRALEDIVRLMDRQVREDVTPAAADEDRREAPQPRESAAVKANATGSAKPSRAHRERILKIIHGLREKGQTYEGIARHLETQNIPTLSGRGKWRSQTIYRLYKESV